jgi:hypothetical protein
MTVIAPDVALTSGLAHRRWVRRARPFPHVVARDVFTPEYFTTLEEHFAVLQREHRELFQRNMPGYDAASADLSRHADGPLGVFLSRAWHDLVAGVSGVEATGDVLASLHHHEPGGKSGWPHNDLNPGWFAGAAPAHDEVRFAFADGVGYHHGTRPPGVEARETVRAVSLLFYLGNPPWQPGNGGETGLFADVDGRGARAAVAPLNNSLVLFECTPFSWHAFLSNAQPRNSLVMWLHRPKEEAVARWGEQSIVYW